MTEKTVHKAIDGYNDNDFTVSEEPELYYLKGLLNQDFPKKLLERLDLLMSDGQFSQDTINSMIDVLLFVASEGTLMSNLNEWEKSNFDSKFERVLTKLKMTTNLVDATNGRFLKWVELTSMYHKLKMTRTIGPHNENEKSRTISRQVTSIESSYRHPTNRGEYPYETQQQQEPKQGGSVGFLRKIMGR